MVGQIQPPEMVEAGPRDWRNVVGTGPFYISEYVPGSHMAYAPNLDYWRTTTINGVEYEIPFIDKLVLPFIEDETTAVAALRTGVLDLFCLVRPLDAVDLARTNPELLKAPTTRGVNFALFLRTDHPPFDDVEVRRAVMIGTNREAIHEAVIIEGETYAWPIAPGISGYVPLEDLPPETRMLYDYNPELARQMLADAGYPDGFDIEMTIELEPSMMGISEMLAGMWLEDMGISVEIKAYEVVAVEEIRAERRYLHSFMGDGMPLTGIDSIASLFSTGGPRNFSNYSNE